MKLGTTLKDRDGAKHSSVGISRIEAGTQSREYKGMELNPLGWQVVSVPISQKDNQNAQTQEIQNLQERVASLEKQLNEAKGNQEQGCTRAREQGYAQGHQVGVQEGRAAEEKLSQDKINKLQNEWQGFITSLETQKIEWVKSLEEEALALINEGLKSLLGTPTLLEEALMRLVREGLSALAEQRELKIFIHPDFLKGLEKQGSDLWAHLGVGTRTVTLEADSHIPRGSVRIEAGVAVAAANLQDWLTSLNNEVLDIYRSKWGNKKSIHSQSVPA